MKRQCFLFVACFLLLFGTRAFGADGQSNELPLKDVTPKEDFGLYVDYFFEDRPLEAADLLAMEGRFLPLAKDRISFGVETRPIWLRMTFVNKTGTPKEWLLSTGRTQAKHLAIYQRAGNELQQRFVISDPVSWAQGLEDYGAIAVPFHLGPDARAEFYIRYETFYAAWLPMVVGGRQEVVAERNGQFVVSIMFAVAICAIVLINFLYFTFTRRGVYLIYCVSQLLFVYLFLHQNSVTTVFLFAHDPDIGKHSSMPAAVLGTIAMVWFARAFLKTQERYPSLDTMLKVMSMISFLGTAASALCLLWAPALANFFFLPVAVLVLGIWLVLPVLGARAAIEHSRRHWSLAAAWALFALSYGYMVVGAALEPPDMSMEYFFGPIALAEVLLVSLALALDVKRIDGALLETEVRLTGALKKELATNKKARQLQEEKLLALQDIAEKGKLVLAAAHDTRNMLGTIRQYSSVLEAGDAPVGATQAASAQIRDMADMLEQMQSLMIDAAVGGASTSELLAIETMDAASVLEGIKLMHGKEARERSVRLEVSALAIPFASDRLAVTRILSNLVSNALRYSGSARVLLSARRVDGWLRFQVWDQGGGMDETTLSRVMSPDGLAYRADSDDTGTGNGLKIAQQLSARICATLEARSEPGKGTVFTLSLPLGARIPSSTLRPCGVGETGNVPGLEACTCAEALEPEGERLFLIDPAEISMEELAALDRAGATYCFATYDRALVTDRETIRMGRNIIFKPIGEDAIKLLLWSQEARILKEVE